VLVARREKELSSLAENLSHKHSVSVRILPLDLGSPDFLARIDRCVSGLDIGLLVYNATFPAIGRFLDQPPEDHARLIDVNCRAQVLLVHHFCGSAKGREKSGIILMSSLSAFHGTPLLSHYGASKAYTLALGEGLAQELAGRNVDVLVSCPGATRTENFLESIPEGAKLTAIPIMEPADAAERTLRALGTRSVYIPGCMNKTASFFMRRILSRKRAVKIMESSAEKLYGKRA
jgi:short-subunit dehydrogenase